MLLNYTPDMEQDSCHIMYTPTESTVQKPFYIHDCGYYNCRSNFQMEHSGRDHYMIIVTVSGVGILVSDGYTYRLPAGSAVLVNSRKKVQYYKTGPTNWKMYWCNMSGSHMEEYETYLNEKEETVLEFQDIEPVARAMKEMLGHAEQVMESSDFAISNELSQVLTAMTMQKKIQLKEGIKPKQVEIIETCTKYMEDHFREKVSLEEISEMLDVSKYYLIRIYKDVNKITPYEYLTIYRVSKAKKLIQETAISIEDISSSCGFLNANTFIRAFKKYVGMTPTSYKKL